jgi:hypothetical protein
MAVNLNKEKKKKFPWISWGTYFMVGIQILLILLLAIAVVMLVIAGFKQQPIITSCVIGFLVLIFPVGYFVVHVLGWRPDEW